MVPCIQISRSSPCTFHTYTIRNVIFPSCLKNLEQWGTIMKIFLMPAILYIFAYSEDFLRRFGSITKWTPLFYSLFKKMIVIAFMHDWGCRRKLSAASIVGNFLSGKAGWFLWKKDWRGFCNSNRLYSLDARRCKLLRVCR